MQGRGLPRPYRSGAIGQVEEHARVARRGQDFPALFLVHGKPDARARDVHDIDVELQLPALDAGDRVLLAHLPRRAVRIGAADVADAVTVLDTAADHVILGHSL